MRAYGYPRYGLALSPAILKPMLMTKVADGPAAGRCLADLDASVWDSYDEDYVTELASLVEEQVRFAIAPCPRWLLDTPLRIPPLSLWPAGITLTVRTENCLRRAGIARGDDPGILTVRDLMSLRGFGAFCFIDLVSALEVFGTDEPERTAVGGDSQRFAPSAEMAALLREMAQALPADSVGVRDPRLSAAALELASALGLTSGSVGDVLRAAESWLEGAPATPRIERGLEALADAVRATTGLAVEQELADICTAVTRGGRNAEIVSMRLGWDGSRPRTLEQVGRMFGLTRERVRQIESKATARMHVAGYRLWAPAVDAVLGILRESAPTTVDDFQRACVDAGVSDGTLSVEGLFVAAQVLDRSVPDLDVEGLGPEATIASPVDRELQKTVLSEARRRISKSGLTTVAEIAAVLAAEDAVSASGDADEALESKVRHAVDRYDGAVWLDDARQWVWMTPSACRRNRMLNQVRKILFVAPRISLAEMRAAVRRSRRMGGYAPPKSVLAAFLRLQPGILVEGDWALSTAHDGETPLGETEQAILAVLREMGPLLRGAELVEHLVERGVNQTTATIVSLDTPIVRRYAPGIYGLVGEHVPPGLIERLSAAPASRSRSIVFAGWEDGKIRLVFSLTTGSIRNGVVSVPTSLARFLCDEIALLDVDDIRVGTLSSNGKGSVWGLSPFFRRRGVEAGDVIEIVIDLTKHEAVVRLTAETDE